MGETIIEVAQRNGVESHLLHARHAAGRQLPRLLVRSRASARWRRRAAARRRPAWMCRASTAAYAQKMIVEMLVADVPDRLQADSSSRNGPMVGIGKPRFPGRAQPAADVSHPAMAVNLDACIQCTRCVRACREVQVNDVIGYAFRGGHSKIVFDLDDPMGESTCVACGECVQACPTGALAPAKDAYLVSTDRAVPSVCPYCGVGCQLTYHIKDNEIIRVEGRDGLANQERLCVKGASARLRHHAQR